jgi:hypothetical protein
MRRRIAASAGLAALLLIWNARDRARPWATRVEAESAMCAASLGLVLPSGALASGGKRRVRSMDGLAEWHTSATTERATIFRRLYDIERTVSYSHVPPAMRRRLEAAGRSPADFESQVSVVVQSRVLPSESVAFNQVRAQRFVGAPRPHDTGAGGSLDAAAAALHCQLPGASDFCDPHNRTLADPRIGYLTNGAAVGFANMGRLTALHGVVATARFVHPLALHADDVLGMVLLCHEWFGRARTQYGAAALYPTFSFDLLRNGGASQVHPHMQPHAQARRYPGRWEALFRAACEYGRATGRSYFGDVAHAHADLGLMVKRNARVIAYVSLTSVGSGSQIELLSDGMEHDAEHMRELGAMLHEVLVAAQRGLSWDGFSASCALPRLDSTADVPGGLPHTCRLVQRGRYDSMTSDISSNELFETPVVSIDPFNAAERLRMHLA